MSLLLTAAKQTGDLDSNHSSYTHVKIIITKHDSVNKTIDLVCQYGVDDGYGNWSAGVLSVDRHTIMNIDGGTQHYNNVLGTSTVGSEQIGVATARTLYEWLINEGKYAGTYQE